MNADDQPTLGMLLNSAYRWLGLRDHSKAELWGKLAKRFPEAAPDLIDAAIEELLARNHLCDQRFAESFVRSRVRRGQGPVKIRHDMRRYEVADELVDVAMEQYCGQWRELAEEVRAKKFGSASAEDFKAWAKQMRFLQQRGFESAHLPGFNARSHDEFD